ncbi:MAG TPA: hypothetical protein VJT49_26095 [Amycolatopsis sp.]|uniref:hypothetical protein n=1 Tax=Amycolatopsis sp. TaxID=37632 RepID=UPI002B49700B|nr:hypothetical protein [Amycolatopsis sp.]HKS48520.1 hypothetical protein [Amycolatopsis sp.]
MTDVFPAVRRVTVDVGASRLAELAGGLARTAEVLTRHGLVAAPWRTGEAPGTPTPVTEEALADYLGDVEAARSRGEAEPCLLVSGDLVVVANVTPPPPPGRATVWFPLLVTPPVDTILALLGDLATALGAGHAHIEDDRLVLLYQSRRATERARAAVPEEYRAYIPDPPDLPVAGLIPQLLVPQEYDTRHVPPGVWWVNYWGATQVQTVGEDLVRAASWARIEQAGDGALLLAATDEPLDPERADHVARLSDLVGQLGLRALQDRFRYA